MSRQVKYIVVKDEYGNETPVIFGANFQHFTIAARICGREDVISAGFVSIEDLDKSDEYGSGICVNHKLTAYGKSVSLNKDSREEDSELLNYTFYGRR